MKEKIYIKFYNSNINIYDDKFERNVVNELEESLRILYVASTRAKNVLIYSLRRSSSDFNIIKQDSDYISWAKWIIKGM